MRFSKFRKNEKGASLSRKPFKRLPLNGIKIFVECQIEYFADWNTGCFGMLPQTLVSFRLNGRRKSFTVFKFTCHRKTSLLTINLFKFITKNT